MFGGWVGGLYVHTLVKNLLIKFLMMLFLVAKGCKFDSCREDYSLSIEDDDYRDRAYVFDVILLSGFPSLKKQIFYHSHVDVSV